MAFKGWENCSPDQFPEWARSQLFDKPDPGRQLKRSEQKLQISCIEWADQALFPESVRTLCPALRPPLTIGDFLHHTPNGGGRSKAEGGIFKAMGVRAGYPDLSLDLAVCTEGCAPRYLHGWRCELKIGDAQLRQNQNERRRLLLGAGYVFDEARTLEQFIDRLLAYLYRGQVLYGQV